MRKEKNRDNGFKHIIPNPYRARVESFQAPTSLFLDSLKTKLHKNKLESKAREGIKITSTMRNTNSMDEDIIYTN